MRVAWCLALVACLATPLAAQRLSLGLEGGASALRVQSLAPTGVSSEYTGTVFDFAGELAFGRVALELGYREGRLAPARDVVEAWALFTVRPATWLALRGGPHARSYVTSAGTERWVLWEARVRTEHALAGPGVRVYAEFWRALAGEVSAGAAFDRGQGAEVGLTVRPWRPIRVRLAYAIDDGELGGGVRRETADALTLGVRLWGR